MKNLAYQTDVAAKLDAGKVFAWQPCLASLEKLTQVGFCKCKLSVGQDDAASSPLTTL